MTRIPCLIVVQPYASLIVHGQKRWEFRTYDPKKTGKIGIAASNAPPWHTRNTALNRVSQSLPRGVVLGTADLVSSFFVTSDDLKKRITDPIEIMLQGQKITTYAEPIGEPIEDVDSAINAKSWNRFAWVLDNIQAMEHPILFQRMGRSTWVDVDIP